MDTGTACRGSGSDRHNIADRKPAACPFTITRRGKAGVHEGRVKGAKEQNPAKGAFQVAAGEGFEPSLTDPELVSMGSPLFAGVSETAYLSRISTSRIFRCLLMFVPVTVKSLSDRRTPTCLLGSEKRASEKTAGSQGLVGRAVHHNQRG